MQISLVFQKKENNSDMKGSARPIQKIGPKPFQYRSVVYSVICTLVTEMSSWDIGRMKRVNVEDA